jgi:hypothetical protein
MVDCVAAGLAPGGFDGEWGNGESTSDAAKRTVGPVGGEWRKWMVDDRGGKKTGWSAAAAGGRGEGGERHEKNGKPTNLLPKNAPRPPLQRPPTDTPRPTAPLTTSHSTPANPRPYAVTIHHPPSTPLTASSRRSPHTRGPTRRSVCGRRAGRHRRVVDNGCD